MPSDTSCLQISDKDSKDDRFIRREGGSGGSNLTESAEMVEIALVRYFPETKEVGVTAEETIRKV